MSDAETDRKPEPPGPPPRRVEPPPETCDYCGSTDLQWLKCKLICRSCHQINKSCSDL